MPKPRYYWDAGLFIALLQNEQRKDPADMPGLLEVVDMADNGEAFIITSGITYTEVLDQPGHAPKRATFRQVFERPNYQVVEPSLTISDKAADFREVFKLKLPDATHLATAVLLKVDEMHTFDADDLIPLSGRAEVNGLLIRKPAAPQKRLAL